MASEKASAAQVVLGDEEEGAAAELTEPAFEPAPAPSEDEATPTEPTKTAAEVAPAEGVATDDVKIDVPETPPAPKEDIGDID